MQRAKDRVGLNPWKPGHFEQRIIRGEGQYYWDRQYENYQVVFDKVVFPFHLRLHDSRPGLLAYVETALPGPNGFRNNQDRYQALDPGSQEKAEELREMIAGESQQ